MFGIKAWKLLLLVALLFILQQQPVVHASADTPAEAVPESGGEVAAVIAEDGRAAGGVPEPPKEAEGAAHVDSSADGEGGDAEEEDLEKPAASVIVLTGDNFEHLTQAATGATTGDWFIKFYAPWCGHCKRMAPAWDDLAQELAGQVNVAKVDVTGRGGSTLQKRFDIRGFPTLLFFRHGKVYTYKGSRSVPKLAEFARGRYGADDVVSKPVPPVRAGVFSKESFKQTWDNLEEDVNKLMKGEVRGLEVTSYSIITMVVVAMLGMLWLLYSVLFGGLSDKQSASAPKSESEAMKKDD